MVWGTKAARQVVLALALLTAAGAANPARAAEPNPTELAVARKLFQEAVELENREDFEGARKKLRAALEIKETPGLRFHLGYCAEQLGQFVAALIEYERALDLIKAGQRAPDVERQLPHARERVQAQIARLSIFLPSGVSKPKVWLDGEPIALQVLGRPAPVDPGQHRIRVEAEDHEPFEAEVTLGPGQSDHLDVRLKKKARVLAESPASPPSSSQRVTLESSPRVAPERDQAGGIRARDIVLISEATVALVGAGVGIGFLLNQGAADARIREANKELDRQAGSDTSVCAAFPPPKACSDLREAIADYEHAGTISTVGFIAGGVGAVAAVVTYLVWPSSSDKRAFVVGPSQAGLGLSASGQF